MNASMAFCSFVGKALTAERAARFRTLSASARGQDKLLKTFDHDFERALRADARRGQVNRHSPCYAFHYSVGFGRAFQSVAAAYQHLDTTAANDGWLIIVADGSGGIYRPEARSDDTVEILG